jgi:hypothetical protein
MHLNDEKEMFKLKYFLVLSGYLFLFISYPIFIHASVDPNIANILDYGATANDSTDDTIAIQNAFNSGKTTLHIPSGHFKINGSLNLVTSGREINIIGEPNSILDGTQSTADNLMQIGGYSISNFQLSGELKKGDTKITLPSSQTLNIGDVFYIQSTDLWVPSRSYYYKGELAKVVSVSENTITLENPLYDNYTAATSKITKLYTPKVTVNGLTVIRDSNQGGINIEYAKDVILENSSISGAREHGFKLNYVYNGKVDHNKARDFWYPGTGTSYGLVVTSSQNIEEMNNDMLGGRHAIAHGGSFPVRNIYVHNNLLDSYRPARQQALDFHENAENVIIENNVIHNSLMYLGKNGTIIGNTIIADNMYGIEAWLYHQQTGYLKILNNNITILNQGYAGILFVQKTNNLNIDTLEISGNIVNSKGSSVEIEASPDFSNFTINHLILKDNQMTTTGDYSYAFATKNENLHIGSMDIIGGTYKSSLYNTFYVSNGDTLNISRAAFITSGTNRSAIESINKFKTVNLTDVQLIGPASLGGRNNFSNIDTLTFNNVEVTNFKNENSFTDVTNYYSVIPTPTPTPKPKTKPTPKPKTKQTITVKPKPTIIKRAIY